MDKRDITPSQRKQKTAVLTTLEAIQDEHYAIIDKWFNNGYNGAGAVKHFKPNLTEGSAKVLFNQLIHKPNVKKYIADKRQELRASMNIEPEQVMRELVTWLYVDATAYIGLTPEQLKALPLDVKACIQSIKHRKKEYTDRQGNAITEEVLEVRIVDKTKAVEILNKMLGNYALDNKQKASNINIQNLNVAELKVLANILQKTEG